MFCSSHVWIVTYDSHIYTLWQEEGSGEKPGWYLAKVLTANDRGEVRLKYRKGGLIEDINSTNIRWVSTKGNGKWFLPPSSVPTSATMHAG